MRKINIPVFVPHKGCPNDCVFCNQKKITGVNNQTPENAARIIEEALKTMPNGCFCQAAFFGGSFTAIETKTQIEYLEAVQPYIKSGAVNSIRISTRPDCITDEILDMLIYYNVRAIELGVQSTDDEVLRLSNRGHTFEDVKTAAFHIKKHEEIELGLQMMVGLPGDTHDKSIKTAMDIINLGADTTRIYPTLVIEKSGLEDLYRQGKYKPLTVDEAVNICAELYTMFNDSGVCVLRMGLMASEEICEQSESVVAGPIHSSFGELVHSRIFVSKISEEAKRHSDLTVYVNPRDFSKAVGNKKKNISYIYENFGCRLKVLADEAVNKGDILIK